MSQILTNYLNNGSVGSTVGGTGTAIKYFPNITGPSIGVAPSTPSATSAVGQMEVPGSNRLNGQIFEVVASGNFLVGAGSGSTTVNIQLQANTGTRTSPTYTTIAQSGVVHPEALAATYYPWFIDCVLEGDTLSGIVQGTQFVMVDSVVEQAWLTLTNSLTGIAFGGANEPAFGLVVGITFGTSNAANAANLYAFQLLG